NINVKSINNLKVQKKAMLKFDILFDSILSKGSAEFVYRGYISKDYTQTGQVINDDKAFLYSITDQREKPLRLSNQSIKCIYKALFTSADHGLNVGVLWFLNGNKAQVSCITGNHYKVNAVETHGNDLVLTECEVYRVEGDHLAKPWRNALWTSENKEQLNVLLVGQVWAGKSSFFNTINSIFRGNMQGHHWQCRQKPHHTGYAVSLYHCSCDTMGLEEATGGGLDMDDIVSIYKSHVQDRYQVCRGTMQING
uniref:Uncharacterized protein n=1 Tax=Salmo trutta TaxID=8032 RepID=A0A674CYF8_SALTR